jgi:hypothetical protein
MAEYNQHFLINLECVCIQLLHHDPRFEDAEEEDE